MEQALKMFCRGGLVRLHPSELTILVLVAIGLLPKAVYSQPRDFFEKIHSSQKIEQTIIDRIYGQQGYQITITLIDPEIKNIKVRVFKYNGVIRKGTVNSAMLEDLVNTSSLIVEYIMSEEYLLAKPPNTDKWILQQKDPTRFFYIQRVLEELKPETSQLLSLKLAEAKTSAKASTALDQIWAYIGTLHPGKTQSVDLEMTKGEFILSADGQTISGEAWNPENDELLHLVHHMRLEKASIDFPQSFENPTSWRKHSEARPMGSRPPNAKLGIGYHDVDGGWLIKEVLKDSVASTAGLSVGDLIQTINSAPARKFSAKQLHKLLTDDSVILGILSQDGSQRIIRVERIAY